MHLPGTPTLAPQLGAVKLDACLPQVLLLSRLCRAQPALLAGHLQPLKDCLAHFAGLPPEAAMALLRALWPLCRVRRELQDHVVMLLRKVMYGRDANSRWAPHLGWGGVSGTPRGPGLFAKVCAAAGS